MGQLIAIHVLLFFPNEPVKLQDEEVEAQRPNSAIRSLSEAELRPEPRFPMPELEVRE